ncbi:laminin subunit alpha-2-like [Notothenia coriiceps]|uniref:Laminin subunit alpha-2-like n=1 Tax=Notothenia coriiceps TaxID=8208 RepID=A0A6I9MXV1_9TELE|nr:PREDICTED: laminin subunit alpha-2-like [Notothenia coriiceps]
MALTRLFPLLSLLLLFIPLSTLGQRYRNYQQLQQKQQQQLHLGNYESFSPTCQLGREGELLCDQCQPGYTGPRCDRCSNGFFGRPSEPGGSCQPCDCHDNLDLSIPGSCDPITGQCLLCRQGYGGSSCDSCADGYHGDAITAKNCQRE